MCAPLHYVSPCKLQPIPTLVTLQGTINRGGATVKFENIGMIVLRYLQYLLLVWAARAIEEGRT